MISLNTVRLMFILLICVALISPLAIFYARNYLRFELSHLSLLSDEQYKLQNSPYSQSLVFNYLEKHVPGNHCVLVFRQAEIAYYQSKCTVSYLDPRLIDAYTSASKLGAINVLRELSVSHIAVPADYGMAEINHSPFAQLLEDRSFSRIAIDTDSIRVFELYYDAVQSDVEPTIIQRQYRESDISFVGGKVTPKLHYTGGGNLFSPPRNYSERLFDQPTEVVVEAELVGNGFYRLMGMDYERISNSDPSEWVLKKFLVWEGLVDDVKAISARIIRPKNSSSLFRFSVQAKNDQKMGPIRYLASRHYLNTDKQSSNWVRAIDDRWWLWASPERSSDYVDWGVNPLREKSLVGSIPNDRQFFIGKLLRKSSGRDWLNLNVNTSGIQPMVYVQWLSNRRPQTPLIYKIESDLFGLRDNQKVEKAMGGILIKHLLPFGFESKHVSRTRLVDSKDIINGVCLKIPDDTDSSRVVFAYQHDKELPATALRNFQIDDFNASYSDINECSAVN